MPSTPSVWRRARRDLTAFLNNTAGGPDLAPGPPASHAPPGGREHLPDVEASCFHVQEHRRGHDREAHEPIREADGDDIAAGDEGVERLPLRAVRPRIHDGIELDPGGSVEIL